MMNKTTKDVATKDAAAADKDAHKRPSGPKKLRCNGCDRPSDSIACPSCLASNGRKCERFGCNRNLPANGKYKYCKACSCTSHNCSNACVSGQSYCQQCIDGWKVTCYICTKRRATVSFQTCKPCDEARKMCEKCRRYKVSVDQDSKAFLKFCSRCLCKSCTSLHAEDSEYCDSCVKCLCLKCNRQFSELGSEMCLECTRRQTQPCGNTSCKGRAGFDMTQRAFYEFCRDCICRGCGQLNDGSERRLCGSCRPCAALNCFRITPGLKHEYCGKCNDEYRSGRVKCIGNGCKLYTKKESGICGACTASGVDSVPIPHKKTEPVSASKPVSATKPVTATNSSFPTLASSTPATVAPKSSAAPAAPKPAAPAAAPAVSKAVPATPVVAPVASALAPVKPEPSLPVASSPSKVKLPASVTMMVKGATVVVIPSADCAAEEFDAVSLAIRGLAQSPQASDETPSPSTPTKNHKARRARTRSSAAQWGDDDRCAA